MGTLDFVGDFPAHCSLLEYAFAWVVGCHSVAFVLQVVVFVEQGRFCIESLASMSFAGRTFALSSLPFAKPIKNFGQNSDHYGIDCFLPMVYLTCSGQGYQVDAYEDPTAFDGNCSYDYFDSHHFVGGAFSCQSIWRWSIKRLPLG